MERRLVELSKQLDEQAARFESQGTTSDPEVSKLEPRSAAGSTATDGAT
jgi:hypothetical protein